MYKFLFVLLKTDNFINEHFLKVFKMFFIEKRKIISFYILQRIHQIVKAIKSLGGYNLRQIFKILVLIEI